MWLTMFSSVPRSVEYSPITDIEDNKSLSTERSSAESSRVAAWANDDRRRVFTICSYTSLALAICCAAGLGGYWLGQRYPSNYGATRHVAKYSPILEDLDISYSPKQFNGTFVHENIYRQNASDEVDAAWASLGTNFRPVFVPEELAAKAGLTKDHFRIREKYGGGYPVFVEGLHQLHCLNLLRKSLFFNYEHYHTRAEEAFSDSERVQRWHITHCLDFIRQRLMCTMDVGVFGSVWVNSTAPEPFVDFNTQHVCRDFASIRDWAEQHQMPNFSILPVDFFEVPGPDNGIKVWDLAP